MGNVGASQMLIEVRVGLKPTFAATLDTVSDSLAKAFRYLQMRGVSRLWTRVSGARVAADMGKGELVYRVYPDGACNVWEREPSICIRG